MPHPYAQDDDAILHRREFPPQPGDEPEWPEDESQAEHVPDKAHDGVPE